MSRSLDKIIELAKNDEKKWKSYLETLTVFLAHVES